MKCIFASEKYAINVMIYIMNNINKSFSDSLFSPINSFISFRIYFAEYLISYYISCLLHIIPFQPQDFLIQPLNDTSSF